MDGISFQSRIRLVTPHDINVGSSRFTRSKVVDYPWTIKQSVVKNEAITRDVIDCSVLGITDGKAVFLNHICPTMEENLDFRKINNFIKSKLKGMDIPNLQGFLLGSVGDMDYQSRLLFENFRKLMNELKIPTSVFRHGLSKIDVSYSSKTDEWQISNAMVSQLRPKFSPLTGAEYIFEEVIISPKDEISW